MRDLNSKDRIEALARPGASVEVGELGQTVPIPYSKSTGAKKEIEAGRSSPLSEMSGAQIPVASIETSVVMEYRLEEVATLAR